MEAFNIYQISRTRILSKIMILTVLAILLCPCVVCGDYLFRASPGGDGVHPSGLWGGQVAVDHLGREGDMFVSGYGSLDPGHVGSGLTIDMASYDPVSQSVLLLVDDTSQTGADSTGTTSPGMVMTAAYGPLCPVGEGTLETLFLRARLADPDNPYLMDSECGIKCGWGPFAFYAGRVYFILSGVFGTSAARLTRQIQLRVLEGCEDELERAEEGSDTFDFDVVGCSRLVSVLHTETYSKPNPRPPVWTAPSLTAVNINNQLNFFLQMFDTTGSYPVMKLVRFSSADNTSEVLHSVEVESRYASNLRIRGSGSVDYRDGVLCWSATDRLLCSQFSPGSPLDPATVLDPGDVVQAGICTGSLPLPELANSITGVAIADTGSSLSVYFGCYSDIAGIGGVGLVKVSNHGLQYTLHTVRSGSTKVFGGSLFLTKSLTSYCPSSSNNPSATTPVAGRSTDFVPSTSSTSESVNTTGRVTSSTVSSTTQGIWPSDIPGTGDSSHITLMSYIRLLMLTIVTLVL